MHAALHTALGDKTIGTTAATLTGERMNQQAITVEQFHDVAARIENEIAKVIV